MVKDSTQPDRYTTRKLSERPPLRELCGPSQITRGKPAAADQRQKRKTLQIAHAEKELLSENPPLAERGRPGIDTFYGSPHELNPEQTEVVEPRCLCSSAVRIRKSECGRRRSRSTHRSRKPQRKPRRRARSGGEAMQSGSGAVETKGAEVEARDMEAGT